MVFESTFDPIGRVTALATRVQRIGNDAGSGSFWSWFRRSEAECVTGSSRRRRQTRGRAALAVRTVL